MCFFLTYLFRGCQEQPSNPCQVNTLKTDAWFFFRYYSHNHFKVVLHVNVIFLDEIIPRRWSHPVGSKKTHTLEEEARGQKWKFSFFGILLLVALSLLFFHINLYEVFFKPKSSFPHFWTAWSFFEFETPPFVRLEIKVQLWLQIKSFEFHFVKNIHCNITL